MIQLRDWLNTGRPELLAMLVEEHQTLYIDAVRISICQITHVLSIRLFTVMITTQTTVHLTHHAVLVL